jgi:hypothetical protein
MEIRHRATPSAEAAVLLVDLNVAVAVAAVVVVLT